MATRTSPRDQILRSELEGFLFQSNPEPMWVYETTTLRFLAVNAAAATRYGYSHAEFLAMTIADIRPAEDVAPLLEVAAALDAQVPSAGVWRHRTKTGEELWADVISHGVVFEGRSARFVVARDVTERARADEENRLLAENMADIVSIHDPAGRHLYVSPSIQKATGHTAAEAMSLRACDAFHGDDLPLVRGTLRRALLQQESCQAEWRRRCKDGSYRWFEAKITRLAGRTGHPRRLICESRDIQQRKEAEEALRRAQEQYRSIFDNAIEGIFQTTPDGRYLAANPALARIYGYHSPGDLIAQVRDVADGLYLFPGRRTDFVTRMRAEGVVINFEAQVRRRDGRIIWIQENAHAVRDEAGNLLYYEGTVEDITDRKTLEAERERLLEEATARADRDPLTNLWNHRVFHKRLKEEDARARRTGTGYALVLLDLDNFRFFNDAHGHAAGDDLLRRVAAVLEDDCPCPHTLARFGGDEFALLLPEVGALFADAHVLRLAARLRDMGYRPTGCDAVIPLHLTHGLATFPADGPAHQDVLTAADVRLLHAKNGGEQDAAAARLRHALSGSVDGFSMLDALVTAVDNKDRYTRRHSEDVFAHCRLIAGELALDERRTRSLLVAALLHDLGKIGVPDSILRKPGPLTDGEAEAVRQHPMMGAVIVGAIPGLEGTLDAIRHHHERWDGGGYPFGLREQECPLSARIMAVADAYSAMTMDRPYRVGMAPSKALEILRGGAGSQWDPACVGAFLRAHHFLEEDDRLAAAA